MKTTLKNFENFVPGELRASSESLEWKDLLVRQFQHPFIQDTVSVPAVDDHLLIINLSHPATLDFQFDSQAFQQFAIRPRDVMLVPAQQIHQVRWKCNGNENIHSGETLSIHVSQQFIAETALEIWGAETNNIELIGQFIRQDETLRALSEVLHQEMIKRPHQITEKLYTESVTKLLAVHLLRYYSKQELQPETPKDTIPHKKIEQAIEYIHANLAENIRLETLAQITHLSTYHFSHLFAQATGKSPYQYVIQLRMEEAKFLLRKTDMRVSVIAQQLGYKHAQHFSTQFRRLMGISPNQYRENFR